jgi:hypothetical protein
MKDNRTYAIIQWNPGLDRQAFSDARKQGLFGNANVTFDSVRKSLDRKKAVVWWRGEVPQRLAGLILWQGVRAELLPQLQTTEWLISKELALARPLAAGARVGSKAGVYATAPSLTRWAAIGCAVVGAALIALKLLGKI